MAADHESLSVVYVEDDERLAELTSQYLRSHGVNVSLVRRGELAVAEVLRERPDVVLLDIMLTGGCGLDICRQLREHLAVPIIMVTALGGEADRVLGLEGGADDYVSKPFSTRELLARIRAQARRSHGQIGPKTTRLQVGNLIIDPSTMLAIFKGKPLSLTSFEFALLRALAERAGRVLGRDQLLDLLHSSPEHAFDRSIDVLVSRLRSKLEQDPRNPRLLRTIRGIGYMLIPDVP